MRPIINQIYLGHTLNLLQKWDNEIFDMCITSPPYWGLRYYGTNPIIWDADPRCNHDWSFSLTNGTSGGKKSEKVQIKGQDNYQIVEPSKIGKCKKCGAFQGELGQEPDYNLYIKHLCDIFDEVKRLLTPHGTLWVNIDDCHFGSKSNENTLPSKSLVGIPFRFATEMINRGWILRNTNIWKKKSPMPESVKDRFSIDFEYVFFFSKKQKYYFKQQFQPLKQSSKERSMRGINLNKWNTSLFGQKKQTIVQPRPNIGNSNIDKKISEGKTCLSPLGANYRTTWDNIKPSKYSGKHFAVFPTDLIEMPINAGCPKWVCEKCGKPRRWIIEREKVGATQSGGKYQESAVQGTLQWKKPAKILKQYWSKCECNAPFRKGIVFDPFIGSGTTALVALQNNYNFLGTELKSDYKQKAEKRIAPFLKNKKIDEWMK